MTNSRTLINKINENTFLMFIFQTSSQSDDQRLQRVRYSIVGKYPDRAELKCELKDLKLNQSSENNEIQIIVLKDIEIQDDESDKKILKKGYIITGSIPP